ncbi:N-6 DNA methylase [Spirulina sp. CS-785/01]|uniref:Eco57I restriction-modification methylase domain-containing protein n=1 Tax=Spirulina sp. CS-785/01 TaxID=3021716 RepID=UPI00232A91B2|nr:DNA methyltransferase [Spirulina sp. CS-785/01]MDB9311801.1 N-6 DNA methylase [Spirulina sp. CS-785/01]
MSFDYETLKYIQQHREWLGFLQPVGLVVSPPALVNQGVYLDRDRAIEYQQTLSSLPTPDFQPFAEKLLDWIPDQDLLTPPTDIELVLTEYGETLRPTYCVPDEGEGWLLLVKTCLRGTDFDQDETSGWEATPQEKFERLLRGTNIPIGVLWNETHLRLVYAPSGESSGYVTFPLEAMREVAGRSILAALVMLLNADRLFTVPRDRRLPQLLAESRRYQNNVSERLAEQVLDALWELLRGFQRADGEQTNVSDDTQKIGDLATHYPQHLYGGLVTTLMRLVFLLYAEERDIMPLDSTYQRHYAVCGLYEKLREDAGNYPDTMDQRYGAWSWLLSLFRLVYDGGGHYPDYLPARHGQLFKPDEYPFLEGRPLKTSFRDYPTLIAPRIPDGVVFRMLDNLLMLEGERLSYRALDVEQIGSVYEGIMGYRVEVAQHPSIAVHSKPKGSKVVTAVVIDLQALQDTKPKDRSKKLKEWANCELSSKATKALKAAQTLPEIIAALGTKISKRTPNTLPAGALYLQPTEERRRSGSHYTPRSLTAPVVETTLQPVFQKLGDHPTPEQLLNLKVCDLAMGSGAFLVEACRQIADRLVEAWERTNDLDPDTEDPVIIARRLVVQQCIYGVDKNPFAVNLAKLSLWLFTLSRDRPFTFLDHGLKCGDSLVGLTGSEIGAFTKDPTADLPLMQMLQEIEQVKTYRLQIQAADTRTNADDTRKRKQWEKAETQSAKPRLSGEVAVAAFFDAKKKTKTALQEKKLEYKQVLQQDETQAQAISQRLQEGETGIKVFNWEIEFPEVFDRANGGFDAILGNPPFLGGKKISTVHGNPYLAWLTEQYPESKGSPDLVAFFFRRAFNLIRQNGTMGLIATNTIAQGGTRSAGLRFICNHGGIIYNAKRRYKWPGMAAIIVSLVHIFKPKQGG